MMNNIFLICFFVIVVALLTLISFGYLEEHKRLKSEGTNNIKLSSIIITGGATVLSKIGLALLSAFTIIIVLSSLLLPKPENIMPAYVVGGSYTYNDLQYANSEMLYQYYIESEERIKINPEIAYVDFAHILYYTGNYDKSIIYLEKAYELNPKWDYACNIGICYGYLMDYAKSIEYLNLSLELDPPFQNRGHILSSRQLIESSFSSWLLSLVKND